MSKQLTETGKKLISKRFKELNKKLKPFIDGKYQQRADDLFETFTTLTGRYDEKKFITFMSDLDNFEKTVLMLVKYTQPNFRVKVARDRRN